MARRYLTLAQWRDLITQQAASNESVVEFCQRLGLSPKSLYHRRVALRQAESSKGLKVVAPPVVRPASGLQTASNASWDWLRILLEFST